MDEKTPQAGPQEQFIELITNLTPNSSAKLKARLLPPATGVKFRLGPFVFNVGYINAGRLQFSAEFYGMVTPDGILRPGGAVEKVQPAPAAPVAKNVTLDVHNSSVDANSIFHREKTVNGQQPAK